MDSRANGVHSTSDVNHAATSSTQDNTTRARDFFLNYVANYKNMPELDKSESSAIHLLPEALMRLVIKHHRAYTDNHAIKVYYKIYHDCFHAHKLARQAFLQELEEEIGKVSEFLGIVNVAPNASSDLAALATVSTNNNDDASNSTASTSTATQTRSEKRKSVTFDAANKKNKITEDALSVELKATVDKLNTELNAILHDNEKHAHALYIIVENPILRGYSNFEADELDKVHLLISRNTFYGNQEQMESVERKQVVEAQARENALEAKIAKADAALESLRVRLYAFIFSDEARVTRRMKHSLTEAEKAQLAMLVDGGLAEPNQSVATLWNDYQNRQAQIAALEQQLAAEKQTGHVLTQQLTEATDRFETFLAINNDDEQFSSSLAPTK